MPNTTERCTGNAERCQCSRCQAHREKKNSSATRSDDSDSSLDAADIYARANAAHQAAVFGADPVAGEQVPPRGVDVAHGGRLLGLEHDPSGDAAPRESGLAEDRRAFLQLAETLYAGHVNALYREAIAGAKASAQ